MTNENTRVVKRTSFTRENIKRIIRKNHWLVLLIIMVMAVAAIRVIPSAYAETQSQQEVKTKWETFKKGFEKTAFTQMNDAFAQFSAIAAEVEGGNVYGPTIKAVILGIAQSMVVLSMLMSLIKEAQNSNGELGMDYWLKIFLYTGVAVIVVLSIDQIMQSLFDLGAYIVNEMNVAVADEFKVTVDDSYLGPISTLPGGKYVEEIVKANSTEPTWYQMQNAGEFLTLLMIVVWAPMIICIFLIYSAVFEVTVRRLFAPIAVAMIAYEGGRSSGVKYLRKYLACFVKIAIYFAIAILGAFLTKYFLSLPSGGMINLILGIGANIVAALAMMQTGGVADEIVGVV